MRRDDVLDMFDGAREKYVIDAIKSRDAKPLKTGIRRKQMYLIAAAIAMALLLVGCGVVYLLTMENLKITDRDGVDSYMYPQGTGTQRILARGGIQGSVQYQAAKEWYDFEIPYVRAHDWDETFDCPPEYEYYQAYSQEMVDKLEALTEKYHLEPVGAEVETQSQQGLLNYLGIDNILLPGAPAENIDLRASYFEGGYLKLDGKLQMEAGEGRWPYKTYVSLAFSPKTVFDSGVFVLDYPENWEEWNYTSASGENFLILYNPNFWESYALCDRGDAMVSVYLQTAKDIYTDNEMSEERMNKRQIEQLLDTIDFSLKPVPGDPALLTGLPGGYDASQRAQTQNGYTVELKSVISDGNRAQAVLGITIPDGAPVSESDGKYWGMGFEDLQLICEGAKYGSIYSAREQDDGDGRDDTVEYIFTWSKQEP